MSEEQLKAFLEKIQGDTSLQEKLKAATTPEAAVEIAKEAGFALTTADIQSMRTTMELEVSDEELEGATGGARHGRWMNNGTQDGVEGRTPGRCWVRETQVCTRRARCGMS